MTAARWPSRCANSARSGAKSPSPCAPTAPAKPLPPTRRRCSTEDGELKGAVNLLIDVSGEQATALAEQAERCHRLANALCDRHTAELLRGMAKGYERNAAALAQSLISPS